MLETGGLTVAISTPQFNRGTVGHGCSILLVISRISLPPARAEARQYSVSTEFAEVFPQIIAYHLAATIISFNRPDCQTPNIASSRRPSHSGQPPDGPPLTDNCMPLTPFYRRRIVLRLALLCIACVIVWAGKSTAAEIEKSPNDNRTYRSLVLDNGLKITLIHDAETDTASAAMDVAVGAGSDPKDREGLAHFLEHMLFLGTEKYPDAGDYAKFIKQNGGTNNAYTAFANTNYYFDIEAGKLEPALDMFAQFFIAPLFTEELVQREKNAVHSEFTGKRREDGQRFWSARKRAFNPNHPMSGFTTGNLDTLADRDGSSIRDELIAFYEKHYSSNIMSLAIIGNEPLDTLEAWATEKFSAVVNQNVEKQKFDIDLFNKKDLPSRVDITPLTDQRFMILNFPIPFVAEHQFTRPRSYIGNILGHEGPGSLLSELKRNNWVTALSAGSGTDTRNSATFDVSIGLTKLGIEHTDDIITEVFHAINTVRESKIPRWLYDESQLLDQLAFQFQEKSSAAGIVRSLSVRAQDWPAEKLISGPYQRTRFDVEGINQILAHMVPDNLQVIVVAPGLSTDKLTAHYDTPYAIAPIADDVAARWAEATTNPSITMPARNEFLPEDLALRPTGHGDPIKLMGTPKLTVWHRTDSSYGVPRANFKATIRTPLAKASAKSNVLTDIYVRMINEQLNEFSYAANLAGLGGHISASSRGIIMNVSGYADGQQQMIEHIVHAMQNPVFDPDLFNRVRRENIEQITNRQEDAPYKRTAGETQKLLYTPYLIDEERITALNSLTIDDLKDFSSRLLQNLNVVVLSHGNLTGTETLQRVKVLQTAFINDATPAHVSRARMIKLPENSQYIKKLEIDHSDSSISIYRQGIERHRASRARYALLRQLLSQPFYEELRTKQQLGYFVFTYSIDAIQVPSVVLALQSPAAGPAKMFNAVDAFLIDFEQTLINMSDAEFQRNIDALVSQVEERDNRLRERTNRYWAAIIREDYNFDASQLFADEVKLITKSDIQSLYRRLFIDNRNGQLVVYSEGSVAKDTSEHTFPAMTEAGSINEFKADKELLLPLSEVDGVE